MRLATLKTRLLWSLTIAALSLPTGAPAATISLQGPAAAITVGNTFLVNVNVATAGSENIWAYQFDILFDPAILQFTDATDGTFLPAADLAFATLTWAPYTPGDGAITGISNSLSGTAPGVSGAGLLAQVRFLALAPASLSFMAPFNTFLLSDSLDQLGGVTETGVQLNINAADTVPEPGTCALLGVGLAAAALRFLSASSRRSRS
jgi:Cohesin domain/PEP-CTERM motif